MIKLILLAATTALLVRAARLMFHPVPPSGSGPEGDSPEGSSLELRRCDRCGEFSLPQTRPPGSFVCASCRGSSS